MKNNYLFCLLFAFFPLFLFAQEKGIGVNMNVLPIYKIETKADGSRYYKVDRYALRPSLYGYKMYRHGTRMIELAMPLGDNYGRGIRRDSILLNYDTLTKKFIYKPYDANYRQFGLAVDFTKSYRVASFYDKKLNIWLGIRTHAGFDAVSYIPTSTTGFERKEVRAVISLAVIPSVTYKVNKRLTLDARWNQPSNIALGLSHVKDKDPQLPSFLQKRYTPIFDLSLIAWNPSFQIGAKYALRSFEEPPIIPKPPRKPSNTYYGVGLNLDINTNDGFRRYEDYIGEYKYGRLRIDPIFSVFRLSRHESIYQQFTIGELDFSKKTGKYNYYDFVKKEFFKYEVQENGRSFAANYQFLKKWQWLSKGIMSVYFGVDLRYYNYYVEAKPTSNVGYFVSNSHNGLRLSTATSILWRLDKKIYLETRFLPNLYYEIEKEAFQDSNPKPLYFGNYSNWDSYLGFDFLSAFQIGLKYILKTEKPAKTKNKPAIKTKK